MPNWLSLVFAGAVMVLNAGLAFGLIKGKLTQVADGQLRTEAAVAALMAATGTLTTTAAVNSAQHAELNRRIDEHAIEIGKHEEILRIVRTRTHVHAQKLMEIDPSWRGGGAE